MSSKGGKGSSSGKSSNGGKCSNGWVDGRCKVYPKDFFLKLKALKL